MRYTLEQHLSRLDAGTHRSAYFLATTDNFDSRRLSKALRERMRAMLDVSKYIAVWAKVDGGILFTVSGPLVVAEIVSSFLSVYRETGGYTESLLYRGPARRRFHDVVQAQLEGYVQSARSYGSSR